MARRVVLPELSDMDRVVLEARKFAVEKAVTVAEGSETVVPLAKAIEEYLLSGTALWFNRKNVS